MFENRRASIDENVVAAHAILVVDDELPLRTFVVSFLQECGYRVVEADDAPGAVAMLEAGTEPIDLIISDIALHAEDGFALARWARRNRPDLPLILTSGSACTADLEDGLRSLGPIVPKPYRGDALARRIRTVLATSAP